MAREKNRETKPADPRAAEPDDVKYGAAVEEIEQILASIDRDEIDLDELGQKVERAVDLLKICRAKLKATEARVTEVLKDLATEEEADEESDDDAEPSEVAKDGDPEEPRSASSRGPRAGEERPSGDESAGDDSPARPKRGRKPSPNDDLDLPF